MRVFEIPSGPKAGLPGFAPPGSIRPAPAPRFLGKQVLLVSLGAALLISVWDSGTTVTPVGTAAHGPAGTSPSVPGAPARGIRVVDGLLSVDALEVDVAELLAELARQADFEFGSSVTAPDPISLRFDLLPLEQGLLLILSGRSYTLAWVDENAAPGTRRPQRLWLFEPTVETAAPRAATVGAVGAAAAPPTLVESSPADLLAELRSGTARVREQAAADLGQVRRAAGRAHGASDANPVIQALASTLADPDAAVRQAAIESLGVIGGDAAALALELALRDPAPRVREAAAEVLGDIGGPTALALLERSRDDGVEYVREAALEAIERVASGLRQPSGWPVAGVPETPLGGANSPSRRR